MTSLLLFLVLWAQGIPVQPTQVGTITGVLKDSTGKPAAGIRVGAVPRPDSLEQLTGDTASMSSLAETDDQGRFRLEGVPPGRYFVAAGILNFPTYYPGTQAMTEGKVVAVAAGETVTGIEFALKDSSGGRIIGTGGGQNIGGFVIPLDIRAENGAKVPLFGSGKVTGVSVVPVAGGNAVTASVTDGSLAIQPSNADYRISMEGLPDGYSVKFMKYGNTEITDGIFRPVVSGGAAAGNIFAQLGLVQAAIPQTLSIVLARAAKPNAPGVSVTGAFPLYIRSAFLSGVSATIYLDRTFEFTGVQPGRHSLYASGSNSKAYGASIVVGNQNINGVELEEASVLPLNARTSAPPAPAGNRAPGRVPLASVRGKLVDAETGEPLTQGDVFLVGDYWVGHPLTTDGKFEFRGLLPGKYEIEVKAVGYPTFRQEFSIDDQDAELEIRSK